MWLGFKLEKNNSNIPINTKRENSKLLDQLLIPGIMSTEAIEEKKVISKVLSLQQIVVSGLSPRLPPHKNAPIRKSPTFEDLYLLEY